MVTDDAIGNQPDSAETHPRLIQDSSTGKSAISPMSTAILLLSVVATQDLHLLNKGLLWDSLCSVGLLDVPTFHQHIVESCGPSWVHRACFENLRLLCARPTSR